MFLFNLEEDFYKKLQGSRCLLLVNFDIDGICACRILQQLFKNDHMVYTLVPVQGIDDTIRAFKENCEDVHNIIMVNCGGTVDVVMLLEPKDSMTFYILDSHRPYDLCNVYSESQIKILGKLESSDEIPEYGDVFRDDSSDEEDDPVHEKKRITEEELLKRTEKRRWSEQRANVLFNYCQYSYYGKSSAIIAFELAWNMSRDNLDIAWWAIVGSTEQSMLNKVESGVTTLEEGNFQHHVSRLTHRLNTDTDGTQSSQQSILKIIYDKDVRLALYRHWTVEASLRNSMSTAVALRLWSIRGEKRLKELLAEMGLPLAQSRQRFSGMDLNLRQEFKEMIEQLADKYKIGEIVGSSFTMHYGYKYKYCASDVVYAMLALMESSTKERSPHHCFLDALDCLSRSKINILENGIEKAKTMLNVIFKTAQSILELRQIVNFGSFLYIVVPESMIVNNRLFAHSHPLIMLAQFVLNAYVYNSRNKKAKEWPLVASANFDEETGIGLIVGIPPICEDQPKSLFGRAFEQAAKNTNCTIDPDYFDTTIIRLKIEQRPKFCDALAALLTD